MAQSEKLQIIIEAQDRASKEIKKSSTLISRNIGKLKIAAVAAGAAALAVGKQVIDLASEAEETQAKFNTVFKNLAKDANEWSVDFADSVGRARTDIKKWMATLQDTFVPLGFAREKGLEFSQTLTTLAVDLASFNNVAEDDAIRDLQSAIVGNVETMRKYGVIINQAVLNQELLNMGVMGGVRAASEAEKAQARLNLIMAGTTDAQGDAERTAGSYANTVRRLRASLRNLGEELGKRLLPIIQKVVEGLIFLTQAVGGVFDAVGSLRDRMLGFLDRLNEKTGFIDILRNAWQNVVNQFNEHLRPALQELFIALEPLMPVLKLMAKLLGTVLVGAIVALAKALELVLIVAIKALTVAVKIVTKTVQVFTAIWEGVKSAVLSTAEAIGKLIEKIKQLNVVSRARKAITGAISGVFGGERAEGGIVTPNKAFLVGERGAELFVPNTAGKIIPNNQLGAGGKVVNVNISIRDSHLLSDDVAEKLADMTIRKLKLSSAIV